MQQYQTATSYQCNAYVLGELYIVTINICSFVELLLLTSIYCTPDTNIYVLVYFTVLNLSSTICSNMFVDLDDQIP